MPGKVPGKYPTRYSQGTRQGSRQVTGKVPDKVPRAVPATVSDRVSDRNPTRHLTGYPTGYPKCTFTPGTPSRKRGHCPLQNPVRSIFRHRKILGQALGAIWGNRAPRHGPWTLHNPRNHNWISFGSNHLPQPDVLLACMVTRTCMFLSGGANVRCSLKPRTSSGKRGHCRPSTICKHITWFCSDMTTYPGQMSSWLVW